MLLLPVTSPREAEGVLERLRAEGLPVRWSVGVSEWLPGEDLDACLARADRSLYRVKQFVERTPAQVGGRRVGSVLSST